MHTTTTDAEHLRGVDAFIQTGVYLRNWSPRTVESYRFILSSLPIPLDLSKAGLQALVIAYRERGLSPGGINLRLRTINSYLSYLHEEGATPELLRCRLLKAHRKAITTLADGDIKRLLAYRTTAYADKRAWCLAVLLLDTGLRLSEALSLRRDNVHLDSLTLKVLGKGSKERFVPISPEGRKHLFLWLRQDADLVFGTSGGSLMSRANAYRDLRRVSKQAGIVVTHPHAFRHYFAVSYIRSGGDIYRLSRILGHSSINTTQLYLRSMGVEHLREGHHSPLHAR